jgi:hypothetical protein
LAGVMARNKDENMYYTTSTRTDDYSNGASDLSLSLLACCVVGVGGRWFGCGLWRARCGMGSNEYKSSSLVRMYQVLFVLTSGSFASRNLLPTSISIPAQRCRSEEETGPQKLARFLSKEGVCTTFIS